LCERKTEANESAMVRAVQSGRSELIGVTQNDLVIGDGRQPLR
jgi:hypothetical protein